jgi:hypothetical protein
MQKLIQREIVDKEQLDMVTWRFYRFMHILLMSKSILEVEW